MNKETSFKKALVKTGVVAGIAMVVVYLVPMLLPLPAFLSTAFFIYSGPLLVVAIVGLYPFLSKSTISVPVILGTIFGVIAGVCRMMFAVVQMTNLVYIRRYIRAAETPEAKQIWQDILKGVFTVQNGLNYVGDFFLDWGLLLFAFAMWKHPKFGKIFSILGVIAMGSHLVMKAYTFPEPPREAGLFDAGPLVAVWTALVVIWVLRNLSWMDENSSSSVS
jgi:hypothetical protein